MDKKVLLVASRVYAGNDVEVRTYIVESRDHALRRVEAINAITDSSVVWFEIYGLVRE